MSVPVRARSWVIAAGLLATLTGACLPLPSSPTPSGAASQTPAPTPFPEPSATAEPTPLPYSLEAPGGSDDRRIQVAVVPELATDGSGRIVVTVTSLELAIIEEISLRWATSLDEHLFLAPFTPSPDRICDTCPPLSTHQVWTKWVIGPGALGEPAGTTTLGWGPLLAGASLEIPIIATRRLDGPVAFDLQFLAAEGLLQFEDGTPAWLRVAVP